MIALAREKGAWMKSRVTPALRLLVVDDHPGRLALITETLTRKFPRADLVEATGAGDAIGLTAMCRFDAIIANVGRIPKDQLATELRAVNPDVPILLLPTDEQRGADEASIVGDWVEENFLRTAQA